MSAPTPEELGDWSRRVVAILGEVELAYGEPSPGSYPSEPEMFLHLAYRALCRARRDAVEAKKHQVAS